MKVVPLYQVKNRLSEYVRAARRGPVIITRSGRPCAAIVDLESEDLEAFLLGHHPQFLAALDRAHARAVRQGGVPLADVEREVKARERAARLPQRRSRRRAGATLRGRAEGHKNPGGEPP